MPNQWTKGVVFLLHGFTKDAYTWFDHRRGDMSKPVLPVMLFDLGYDVWLGNIRGTRYSLSHKKYDAFDDDKKFFNYEIEKIARNDIPTMIEQIMKTQAYYKKRGGRTCKKVNVIAHSAGVGQVLASMTYTVKSDRYVSQVIGIEPCLIAQSDEYYPDLGMLEFAAFSYGMNLLGVESTFGDNWDNQVDLIC